ncbi:MAG TPA: hypothetical protein VMV51_00275, partial [Gemmatimonadaceae bacterium]|nr:hypothetical protein [Gemmatimonadaceae bacterium]
AGKSKTPLIAAIAAVVVLGGGTAAVMMMKQAPAPATNPPAVSGSTADTTKPGDGGGARTPQDTKPGGGAPPGGGTETLRKQQASSPAVTKPAPVTQAPAVDVDALLKSLQDTVDADTFDKAAAQRVLSAMDAVAGRLSTPLQEVSSAIIRASAQEMLGHHEIGCQIIKSVQSKALSTSKSNIVNTMLGTCN